jgi:8-oxo-dGTP diphosphatase
MEPSSVAVTATTVDLVVLTVRENLLQVLLVERGKKPFLGRLALPGGFVRNGEGLMAAALRELSEETSLDGTRLHLEQLKTYGEPERDPRQRVITVAYLGIAPGLPTPLAGTDAAHAIWMPAEPHLEEGADTLAFDHHEILREGVERARSLLEYTTIAAAFCDETFTISQLRHIYETVWGYPVDAGNFHRKVLGTEGFLVPTGRQRAPEIGRPAALYRRGDAQLLNPPLLRAKSAARRRS